jgi:SAM-dependent methyltransferase
MRRIKSPEEVFDEWGKDHHAGDMEVHHWPRVRQAFDLIPKMKGNYLEIGVGNGYGIGYMGTHQFSEGRCFGLDISTVMVSLARERNRDLPNVHIEHGDFLSWNFSKYEPFSVIFSMEVFYYFPEIGKGIDKAYSLLASGGQLWVAVNYYEENTVSHGWPDLLQTPMQLWSMQDYLDAFVRAGFSEVEQRQFMVSEGQTIDPDDPLTLCTWGCKESE